MDQIAALRDHYRVTRRPAAARNLVRAIIAAERGIEANRGVPAPRPYPTLAKPDRAWIHAGRYWFRHATSSPPVLLGIFYETADIPNRL